MLARCTTASVPASTSTAWPWSVRSASSTPVPRSCGGFTWSVATTSYPWARSSATVTRPAWPLAPVTQIRLVMLPGLQSARRRWLGLPLELAPAAGPVVRDDLPEHRGQRGRVDALAPADRHRPGGGVVVAAGDDPFGIGDDGAVVEKHVHVIFGGQQRADVAREHEVRLPRPLDGLGDLVIGSVDQV